MVIVLNDRVIVFTHQVETALSFEFQPFLSPHSLVLSTFQTGSQGEDTIG